METVLTKKKESLTALLLQIPIFILALIGLLNLTKDFVRSLTNLDWISETQFIGLDNYTDVLSSSNFDVIRSTISYFLVVFMFCFVGAILSALFISKLKTIYGVLSCVLISLFSFSACFVSFFRVMFSGDYYGFINAKLLSMNLIKEPIIWLKEYGTIIYLVLASAIIMAPLFIITYLFAKKGKKKVGVMTAVCAMPILFAGTYNISLNLFGYPSRYFSAWLAEVIKFEILNNPAKTNALWIVSIFLFLSWCAVSCTIIFFLSKIIKRIKISETAKKILGYIFFAQVTLKTICFALPNFIYGINTSFKPLDELLVYSPSFMVKRPTLSNYVTYFEHYIKEWDVASCFCDAGIIFLFCVMYIIPSAVGFALFKKQKTKNLITLAFVPWIAFLPFTNLYSNHTTFRLHEFLSGFGVVIVYLVTCNLTKLLINSKEKRTAKMILSIVCVISTCWFVATTVVNYGGTAPYQRNWATLSMHISIGGVARAGSAMVGEVLMFVFTVITAIVPIGLYFMVYLLDKKRSQKIC